MPQRRKLVSVTLKDCEVQVFRSGGKGGQNQNKVSSGVRIIHKASGARGESREYRDQIHNKRAAFRRMFDNKQFQAWLRVENMRALGTLQQIDKAVDRSLAPANLRIEGKDEHGLWTLHDEPPLDHP